MAKKGFYHDPFARSFARFHSGIAWTHIVTDELGVEQYLFDQDIDNERFVAPSPRESDCLEGKPITADNFPLPNLPTHLYQWPVVSEENVDLPNSSVEINGNTETDLEYESGEWVKGFNSRVRLRGDSIEIFVDVSKSRSSRLLSSGQDSLNQGLRTIPLRTIQAVHLTPAARGIMGALQFTVPGALTQQHRDSAGKALRVLSLFTETGSTGMTSQAHENSVSYEMSQQESFVAFHAMVVMRLEEISSGDTATTSEPVDFVGQLRELKLLLDDGILTQEEFDSSKQAILKKL